MHNNQKLTKPHDLHTAVQYGDLAAVKAFLEAGADVIAQDEYGWTPLHSAAEFGHTVIINALIAAGANVNAQTQKKLTPLHHAASRGHTETVNALIAKGADVNAQNEDKETPLLFVAYTGHTETVNALIAAGADTSLLDTDEFDELNPDVVILLIEAGTNISVETCSKFARDNAKHKEFWQYSQAFIAADLPQTRFGEGYRNQGLREAISSEGVRDSEGMDKVLALLNRKPPRRIKLL